MSKRKSLHENELAQDGDEMAIDKKDDSGEEGEEDNQKLIDVDFEWFSPRPIDFHGLKNLLRQLFDCDSQLLELSGLADLIINQSTIGSMVKTDGIDGDPVAFLTALNMNTLAENKESFAEKLKTYILEMSAQDSKMNSLLKELFSSSSQSTQKKVGLILSERVVNVPTEVAAPMYSMLLEELTWAVEDNEPYEFDYYLLISRAYDEVRVEGSEEGGRQFGKKLKSKSHGNKKSNSSNAGQKFFFHPEDQIFIAKSESAITFKYRHSDQNVAESKRVFHDFGLVPKGQMMLLTKTGFQSAVQDLGGANVQKE